MPPKGWKLSPETKARISASRTRQRVERICPICNKIFMAHPTEVDRGRGIYCSKSCASKHKMSVYNRERALKISASLTGRSFTKEHKINIGKSRKKQQTVCICKQCGKEFTRQPSAIKLRAPSVGSFCSRNCSDTYIRGKNHPLWQGGLSFGKYCPKFNAEFKERVRAFFDYKCLECGNPQNGEKLTVHHIQYNKQTCCDGSIPMFAPLCRNCHAKTNFNREQWEQKYADIIQNYYLGKSFFTKEEYAAYKNSN